LILDTLCDKNIPVSLAVGKGFLKIFCFETGSCYVAQAVLELVIPQSQPLQCWDYRHKPPYLA
jgi:hypothetical protein